MPRSKTWLDKLGPLVAWAGNTLDTQSDTINFASGFTVTYNPVTDEVDITSTGGGSASILSGTFASRPVAGTAGRLYLPTDGGYEAYDDGTAWRPRINGILCTQPPAAGAWTMSSNALSPFADSNGSIVYKGTTDITTLRYAVVSGTAKAEAITTRFDVQGATATTAEDGPFMRESTSGRACMFASTFFQEANNTFCVLYLDKWASDTSRSSQIVLYAYNQPPLFKRLLVSGSNLLAQISNDRATWQSILSVTLTDYFNAAPNQVGVATNGGGGTPIVQLSHFDYA